MVWPHRHDVPIFKKKNYLFYLQQRQIDPAGDGPFPPGLPCLIWSGMEAQSHRDKKTKKSSLAAPRQPSTSYPPVPSLPTQILCKYWPAKPPPRPSKNRRSYSQKTLLLRHEQTPPPPIGLRVCAPYNGNERHALRWPTPANRSTGANRHGFQSVYLILDIYVSVIFNWHQSKQGIRCPVSFNHVGCSDLQLLEVTCFLKLITDQELVLD